jgi:protocatechuate 3,4-dioxygenase beta subunit
MNRLCLTFLIAFHFGTSGCSQNGPVPSSTDRTVGGGCDGCNLIYEGMPSSQQWETTLPPAGEPGQPLIISGTIYKKDGKTPAPGIILYVYHTDHSGKYSPAFGQTMARRHGHLRGWMKTGSDGHYQFRTIKPLPYPNGKIPAHIHPIIKEPGLSEYYIDEYLFDDDPILTSTERGKQEKRGGSGIIKLIKNQNGEWTGRRDIVLGMNIPGY